MKLTLRRSCLILSKALKFKWHDRHIVKNDRLLINKLDNLILMITDIKSLPDEVIIDLFNQIPPTNEIHTRLINHELIIDHLLFIKKEFTNATYRLDGYLGQNFLREFNLNNDPKPYLLKNWLSEKPSLKIRNKIHVSYITINKVTLENLIFIRDFVLKYPDHLNSKAFQNKLIHLVDEISQIHLQIWHASSKAILSKLFK